MSFEYFPITTGVSHTYLTKNELNSIPWIQNIVGSRLMINDCLGFAITRIEDDGAMYYTTHNAPIYISRHSTDLSDSPKLYLVDTCYNDLGYLEVLQKFPIRCATVCTSKERMICECNTKYFY